MDDKVEYQISSSVNDGITEIVITGKYVKSEFDKMSNEIIAIRKDVNYMLVDLSSFEGRLSYTEAYKHARNHPPHTYTMNIAMVDNASNANFQSFNETTSLNAGMHLKWFIDINAARDWLKSKQKEG